MLIPTHATGLGADWEAVPVIEDDPSRAVVHGISYPRRDVYDNLVSELSDIAPGPYNIGLLHANVGSDTGHEAYAPCTLDDLRGNGIDYWALGHVHTRDVLSEDNPAVVYPGNPQGRHVNETGARGVYLVKVDGDEIRLDFRPMDTVRWDRIEVDVTDVESDQELHDNLSRRVQDTLETADGRCLVVRITLTGRTPLHRTMRQADYLEDVRESILNAEFAGQSQFSWCERIDDQTASPIDRDELLKGSDFLAEVLSTSERAKLDPEVLAKLQGRLADLYQHQRYRRYLDAYGPSDDDLVALLDGAESLTVDLLAEPNP